mmetsp:Transcript_32298/g.75868  ORF Transcript_32298/g.75868 Transcript_32298/m.75868 type:complete len:151 (-) Transcript_32298:236-688(-)
MDREHRGSRRVYLNEPEVWYDSKTGTKPCLVEPFIKGKYVKFNSNSGWTDDRYAIMQALSHFSYHFTDGQYLLCDLQGSCDDVCYVLTDPVVLSREGREFGVTDTGFKGMESFFANHRPFQNRYCCPSWKYIRHAQRRMQQTAHTTFAFR